MRHQVLLILGVVCLVFLTFHYLFRQYAHSCDQCLQEQQKKQDEVFQNYVFFQPAPESMTAWLDEEDSV